MVVTRLTLFSQRNFFLRRLVLCLSVSLIILVALYGGPWYAQKKGSSNKASTPISDGFDYPVGNSRRLTEKKDGDGWYVARDFGESNHLGEDWNKESGGNTDCGSPVYAASKGIVIFAGESGPGWGKVIIVRHKLPDGTPIETLYGHLNSMERQTGDVVNRKERIGQIGDADGAYPCHLHFEVRLSDSPSWGQTGPGYSGNSTGWMDPSEFIDARRKLIIN